MHKKMENLLYELVNGNSTVMLTFAFTDMFCIAIMFLIYEFSIGGVVALCTLAGTVISGIIMTKATCVAGKERGESLMGILQFFPVDAHSVKKAQYKLAFKITGIQLAVTLVPLIIVCFRFKWQNAVAALSSTAVSMLIMSIFLIEINQILGKRK